MPVTSFASVARRVTAWTSNLLATGVVLLLALGVGRQLVRWYRVDSPEVQPSAAAPGALSPWSTGEPIELDFGDVPYRIQRREVAGDPAAARAALVAACRELPGDAPLGEPTSAENGLLELCRRAIPLAALADGRQIFAPECALPLVVAIRPFPAAGDGAKLASAENRVVMWGMAAPAGESEWHLYLAHAERSASPGSPAPAIGGLGDWIELPLPPGARRMLGLRDRRGGGLSSFAGDGRPATWMSFFSAWFGQRQWSAEENWRLSDGVWRARYRRSAAQRTNVDLEIGSDGGAGLVGFATIEREPGP